MAVPGDRKADLETPCLCLDLPTFETNLKEIAGIASEHGKSWRPHTNSHQCAEVALRQIHAGAIGVTCSSLTDVRLFADAGVRDILIACLPVGSWRVQEIARLCKTSTPIVSCDHYVQASALSEECVRQGVRCRALVEINIGLERTGVRPGRDAIELARGIERLPGLELSGIMGYEGHVLSLTDGDSKRRAIDAAMGILSHTRDIYRHNGLCCDIVSASGTGSFQQSVRCHALTEVQAGGGIFGDPFYARMPDVQKFASALTLLATVVSRPGFDRAVLDVGVNKIAGDPASVSVQEWDDAKIAFCHAEHTGLELGPKSRELRIGDRVQLMLDRVSPTTRLYNQLLAFRGDRLESIWPIGGMIN